MVTDEVRHLRNEISVRKLTARFVVVEKLTSWRKQLMGPLSIDLMKRNGRKGNRKPQRRVKLFKCNKMFLLLLQLLLTCRAVKPFPKDLTIF